MSVESSMDEFVKHYLSSLSDLSSVTIRQIRNAYLEEIGEDDLQEDDKSVFKKIVTRTFDEIKAKSEAKDDREHGSEEEDSSNSKQKKNDVKKSIRSKKSIISVKKEVKSESDSDFEEEKKLRKRDVAKNSRQISIKVELNDSEDDFAEVKQSKKKSVSSNSARVANKNVEKNGKGRKKSGEKSDFESDEDFSSKKNDRRKNSTDKFKVSDGKSRKRIASESSEMNSPIKIKASSKRKSAFSSEDDSDDEKQIPKKKKIASDDELSVEEQNVDEKNDKENQLDSETETESPKWNISNIVSDSDIESPVKKIKIEKESNSEDEITSPLKQSTKSDKKKDEFKDENKWQENKEKSGESSDDDDDDNLPLKPSSNSKKSIKVEKESDSSDDETLANISREINKKLKKDSSSTEDDEDSKTPEKSKKKRRSKSDSCSEDSKKDINSDPKLERLKRFIRTAGLRVMYVKILENCKTAKQRHERLLRVLEDAGLKGKPTLESCKKLRKKREQQRELDELDTSNILPEAGRGRRRFSIPPVEPKRAESSSPSQSPPRIFSRLKDIIDSDGSSD